MIHGDLKGVRLRQLEPFILLSWCAKANILIDQTGRARLADFGLLTIISDPTNSFSSSSSTQGGTVRWMSPELIDPQRFGCENSHPTISSDCYALGMVIYETISGHLPFHRHSGYTVVVKVLEGERPPRESSFMDSLWETLELCWETQPKARPRIEDVLHCLEMERPSVMDVEMDDGDDYLDSMNDPSGGFLHFILSARFHGPFRGHRDITFHRRRFGYVWVLARCRPM
jgi:serine/threonine protein kinase